MIYVTNVFHPHGVGDQRRTISVVARVRVGRFPVGVSADPRTDRGLGDDGQQDGRSDQRARSAC
jgi:hypothetical protein